MMRPFFAVLGGMGTLATESYIHVLNARTQAHTDQEFLDYIVFNDASVPDRTAYILGRPDASDPFDAIADDIRKAGDLGAQFLVLTCNTAHYDYERFQSLTRAPILHMPRLAVESLERRYPAATHPRIGFLGTEGSRVAGVYQRCIESAGYRYLLPDEALQRQVDALIYEDVKSGVLDDGHYRAVMDAMLDADGHYRCDAVILGCTELSVLNDAFPHDDWPLIDAQSVVVDETIRLARQLRQ